MSDDFPINFNEVFTIPENLRKGAIHRINHLINFGQRTALFIDYNFDLSLVLDAVDLIKFYHNNVHGSKLWVIYDDAGEFSQVLSGLNSTHNVVMTQVNNLDIVKSSERDFIILLMRYPKSDVISSLLKNTPGVFLIVMRRGDEVIEELLNSSALVTLYTGFNTFLVKDSGDIMIYELGVKRLTELGYTITPLSRIGDNSKSSIVLLYDNYTTFVKSLIYLLNELRTDDGGAVFITSPNLPLIQKYVQGLRIIRKYNIRFISYNSFLGSPAHIGKGILIIEHPFPDLATMKAFFTARKVFNYVILASNNISFNAFIKSLLLKSNVGNLSSVKQLVELFDAVVKVHMEYSSMSNLVVECYTKKEFSLGKTFVSLIKIIARLKSDAVIKTVNHSAVIEMLESLGWTSDLTSNKKRVILVEPSRELYNTVDKQKIIITSSFDKYLSYGIPIMIDLDKLL